MLAEKQELNDEFMRKELNKIVSNSVGYNHINRFFTVSFLLFILLLSISLILYEFDYFRYYVALAQDLNRNKN